MDLLGVGWMRMNFNSALPAHRAWAMLGVDYPQNPTAPEMRHQYPSTPSRRDPSQQIRKHGQVASDCFPDAF